MLLALLYNNCHCYLIFILLFPKNKRSNTPNAIQMAKFHTKAAKSSVFSPVSIQLPKHQLIPFQIKLLMPISSSFQSDTAQFCPELSLILDWKWKKRSFNQLTKKKNNMNNNNIDCISNWQTHLSLFFVRLFKDDISHRGFFVIIIIWICLCLFFSRFFFINIISFYSL